jgi:hypothetical protein
MPKLRSDLLSAFSAAGPRRDFDVSGHAALLVRINWKVLLFSKRLVV